MEALTRIMTDRNGRYLRIREDAQGRTIEAWVVEQQPKNDTHKTSKNHAFFLFLSLFGWGFMGIALGEYIFFGLP